MENLDWVREHFEKIKNKSSHLEVLVMYNADLNHAIIRYVKKGIERYLYLDINKKKKSRFGFAVTMDVGTFLTVDLNRNVSAIFRVMTEIHPEYKEE